METKIKQVRLSKNMSQAELAKAVGVTQQAISQWENGQREPKLKFIQKLAETLDAPPADILECFK